MWAQALSESMYDLAHTGAQRVAKLCREPSGLACWALELLEEQACMVRSASLLPCSPLHPHQLQGPQAQSRRGAADADVPACPQCRGHGVL